MKAKFSPELGNHTAQSLGSPMRKAVRILKIKRKICDLKTFPLRLLTLQNTLCSLPLQLKNPKP